MNTQTPSTGWSNKAGTAERACRCQTWKQHWLNYSGQTWPAQCAVQACSSRPTLGGHVTHPAVSGEKIVPMCDACNHHGSKFSRKPGTVLVSANQAETCGKTR
jgi:hypothetical protein